MSISTFSQLNYSKFNIHPIKYPSTAENLKFSLPYVSYLNTFLHFLSKNSSFQQSNTTTIYTPVNEHYYLINLTN